MDIQLCYRSGQIITSPWSVHMTLAVKTDVKLAQSRLKSSKQCNEAEKHDKIIICTNQTRCLGAGIQCIFMLSSILCIFILSSLFSVLSCMLS